ncbi:MAG TPA: type VI secretion system-associated FHA domain protein TagH [Stellaceae bacterium]|nr:type VI secretion system-associated FHA domain protein TagH [Stellaceae bacterium]
MTLHLTMLRSPDDGPPESRALESGEFSIGRGANNNWVLPDTKRHISSRHCVIAYRAGGWQVRDYSLNGTFLNREDTPIGEGSVRDLRDGDLLRLGPYEIEVRLTEQPTQPVLPTTQENPANPFDLDPFAPRPSARPAHDPLLGSSGRDSAGGTFDGAAALLPHDYNPLDDDHLGPAQDAHFAGNRAPGMGGHAQLPEDWDHDFALELGPAPPPVEDLLNVFLRGAHLKDVRLTNPAAAMEAMGAAFREMVHGLRQVLVARRDVKTEFRTETTSQLSRGNNPLKVSTSDDEALAALLGAGRRTEMTAGDAIAQALLDIRLHELASLAAMQSAVRALLADLEPEKFSRSAGDGGLNFVAGQRKARAWDAFETHYKRLNQALADNFDSAFGEAFAVAYEKALAELATKEAAADPKQSAPRSRSR